MAIIFNTPSANFPSMAFRDSARFIDEYAAFAIAAGVIRPLGCIRCYVSQRGGTNYAALWVSGAALCRVGAGKASGWGYNRAGAAVDAAIANAGIKGAPRAEAEGAEVAALEIFKAAAEARGMNPDSVYIHHANA